MRPSRLPYLRALLLLPALFLLLSVQVCSPARVNQTIPSVLLSKEINSPKSIQRQGNATATFAPPATQPHSGAPKKSDPDDHGSFDSGTADVSVYFSPKGGAQEAIIREIDAARDSIKIQAYSYTSAPISVALVRAHKRGVRIKVILDKSNQTAQYTGATFLANAGIPVLIDSRHAIAHSKIMLIDGATILTGSFNFTKAAEEKNAENLLALKECPQLVTAYARNFSAHEDHSTPYRRRT
jgi:phosphatidylserine/phosphatidylglycerophosphate/cardiolipin synthase-like enzyme